MMASDLVARIFPHFQDTFAVQMLVARMRLRTLHLVLLELPNADLEAFYQPCSAPLASPYCDKKYKVTWKSNLSFLTWMDWAYLMNLTWLRMDDCCCG